jgi:hypothetical protein
MELLIVRVAGFRLGSRGLIAYGVPQGATFYLAMTQKHVGQGVALRMGESLLLHE